MASTTYTFSKQIVYLSDFQSFILKNFIVLPIKSSGYDSSTNLVNLNFSSSISDTDLKTLENLVQTYVSPLNFFVYSLSTKLAVTTDYSNTQDYSIVGSFVYAHLYRNLSINVLKQIQFLPFCKQNLDQNTFCVKFYDKTNHNTICESNDMNTIDLYTEKNLNDISTSTSIIEIHIKTSSPDIFVNVQFVNLLFFSS